MRRMRQLFLSVVSVIRNPRRFIHNQIKRHSDIREANGRNPFLHFTCQSNLNLFVSLADF